MAITIDDKVQFLKGVGPARAQLFERLGVRTVRDLLYLFPRDYEEPSDVVKITGLNLEDRTLKQTVIAECMSVQLRNWRHVEAAFSDETGSIRAVWFNAAYLKNKLTIGEKYRLSGRVALYRRYIQMQHPTFKELLDDQAPVAGAGGTGGVDGAGGGGGGADDSQVIATYPSTEGLQSRSIAAAVRSALDQCLDGLPELLSRQQLVKLNMPSARAAVRELHRPRSMAAVKRAKRRMIFEEFLLMELAVTMRRRSFKRRQDAPIISVTEKIDRHIRRRFPFSLTAAQNRAVEDIVADIARPAPMARLLQGDVGSGKTVVALYGILAAVARKCQAAIMTPTEILTEQHFESIRSYLVNSEVRWQLLTGSVKPAERARALRRIQSGEIDIVVGTQALIQQDVTFRRLGFVVVDEQHKFGVLQRAESRWRNAGDEPLRPHYLVMTATPIPRTLALTVFGDLDISVIDELPPGRRPIATHWVRPQQVMRMYEAVRTELRQGRQAYVVCPLVEDSDVSDLKSATEECRRLQSDVFPEFKVALLHGRMSAQEKQQAMDDFRHCRTHILVSTIVIEVGIDIPNATVMIIEHAERFGLAQLHQLRGRIGRGAHDSVCYLVARPGNEFAQKRIEVMTQTNDGFRIAEEDLRQRGPGEFFGTRQHGLPELRIGSLIDDYDLLQLARQQAGDIILADPDLSSPQNAALARALFQRYSKTIELIEVG